MPLVLQKNNAVQLLGMDIKQYCPHVAIITETWFNNKHLDSCLSIENYTLIRRDRIKRKGGGVCAYIRNDIKCEIFQCDSQPNNIEILWLKLFYGNHLYGIACFYHPPNPHYQPQLFVDSLDAG